MSREHITNGDYQAKVLAARFINSKKGTLGIEVAFSARVIKDGVETTETMNWVGWLTPDAMKNTMSTLVDVLGFNGNDSCGPDGVLSDPKALDYGREVKLVVERESYVNEAGETKEYPRVKWVNSLGGGGFAGAQPQVVQSQLANVGFRAAFLSAKGGSVQGMQTPAPSAPANPGNFGQPAAAPAQPPVNPFGGAPNPFPPPSSDEEVPF